MTKDFEKQGGASTSDPSRFVRWITSKMMQHLSNPKRLIQNRKKAEKTRISCGNPHRVEYYHQVNDAYSHLSAQILAPLLETYDIELIPYLTGPPSGKNAPEPEMLLNYARLDSSKIAPHYGLDFPTKASAPSGEQVDKATRILATVKPADFLNIAVEVGTALWSNDTDELNRLAKNYGEADSIAAKSLEQAGTQRRDKQGHYSGAMFYYGGEWYWGVDRLYHLENRLIELGLQKKGKTNLIAPRPEIDFGTIKDQGKITLEFYPSLRSPYTSIIFDRTIKLVKDSGIKMILRPVLPMVMRGVPVTRQKGIYIFTDTAREAETLGLNWGDAYDPIGEPVRRAYSLFPWAREQGKEIALLSTFLKSAFFNRMNTNTDKGMRWVVEKAGLSWQEAKSIIGNNSWEDEMEESRLAIYAFGCWGVPCYRLLDSEGKEVLASWGQDRLWLVAKEIKQLLKN